MDSYEPLILGIDVGGTKMAAGVVRFPKGEVLAEKSAPTKPHRGREATLKDVVSLAAGLVEEARSTGCSIEAIGLGICELVAPNQEVLSQSLLQWTKTEVVAALGTFAPVFIEADVRAAARAEAMFGGGQHFHIFLYVTVGTGIASCLMVDGGPYLGARGATGTMASSPASMVCEHCGK